VNPDVSIERPAMTASPKAWPVSYIF
jgi:hypothetical protein